MWRASKASCPGLHGKEVSAELPGAQFGFKRKSCVCAAIKEELCRSKEVFVQAPAHRHNLAYFLGITVVQSCPSFGFETLAS